MSNWEIFLHNMNVWVIKGARYGECHYCGKPIELATPNGIGERKYCDKTCQNDAKSERNRRKYREQKMQVVRQQSLRAADKVLLG